MKPYEDEYKIKMKDTTQKTNNIFIIFIIEW